MSVKIFLDNDFDWDFTLTKRDPDTREPVAQTGMANLKGWIAATPPDDTSIPDAIHAELEVAATEAAKLPGTYYGTHDGDKLRTHLGGGAYPEDTKLYFLFGDKTAGNVQTYTELILKFKRKV